MGLNVCMCTSDWAWIPAACIAFLVEFYSSLFPPSQLTSLYAQAKSLNDTESVHQTGRNTSQNDCVKLQPSEARLMRTKSSWRRWRRRRCDNMNKWIQQHIFRKIYISWRTSSTLHRGIVCFFSSLSPRKFVQYNMGVVKAMVMEKSTIHS